MSRSIYVLLCCQLLLISCTRESEESLRKVDQYLEMIEKISEHKEKSNLRKKEDLQAVFQEIKADKEIQKVKLYKNLGKAFNKVKANEDYRKVAHSLMQYSLAEKDTFGLAISYRQLARYYDDKKQIDSLYKYYYNAAKYFTAVDSFRFAGYSYLSMGIVQKNARDYSGAEASSVKALELLESEGEIRYAASAYNNLGLIARKLDKPEQALAYFDKVVAYRKRVSNNPFIQAGTYNNIGIVYLNMQDYNEAIKWYIRGLSIDNLKNEMPSSYARLLGNKGYALFKNGEHKSAIENMAQAYHLRDSIGDFLGKSTSALHLGELYASENNPSLAEKYFQEALMYSSQTNYNEGRLRSLKWLSEINPSEKAIDYAREHIRINDSLMNAERKLQDHFARVRYETDELKEEKSKAEEQTKWMAVALLSAIVLFLIGYIIKQRSSDKRERLFMQEQQKSNEEIYTLMLGQQAKIERAKQEEKDRVSRELHDSVLSRLFGIRLSLDTLNAGTENKDIHSRAGYIEQLKEVGQEIRQISHDLQKNDFDKEDSNPETIKNLVADYCLKTGVEYSFMNDPSIAWEQISYNTKVHLCRILQEGLTNSVKHGQSTAVDVEFRNENYRYIMTLKDNGLGLTGKKALSGIGVKNMKHRAEEIGGEFNLQNRENSKGVQLTVYFSA